ncbi:hypothetical protein JCM5350_003204 [Sporobolomyces pararoseus]
MSNPTSSSSNSSPHPLTVVIKLGSSSILQPAPPHFPQMSTLSALAETCVSLRSLGHRIVIVSSGAIGMGLHRMELPALVGKKGSSRTMGEKQALAAIGQGRLIALWDQIFGALKQPIAQILLTRNDIADRSRYLNATTTLSTLLSLGVIPIINENDTISVSEILHINKFGDNDTLSAIAAGMCGADYLFLLTDVDSLYSDNPRRVSSAKRVVKVRDLDQVRKLVSTNTLGTSLGTGGMETKLIAAELATAVGCNTVITLGSVPTRILEIVQSHSSTTEVEGEGIDSLPGVEFAEPGQVSSAPHTLFVRKSTPLSSRRFWILHGLTPRGTVYIDYGAYLAISRGERDGGGGGNGGRLLAAGVLRVQGSFAAGQAVRVCVVKNRRGRNRRRSASGDDHEEEEEEETTTTTRRRREERAKSPDHWQDRQEEEQLRKNSSSSSSTTEGRSTPKRLSQSLESLEINRDTSIVKEGEEEEDVFEFGRGLTNYNSVEIDRVKGLRSSDIERVLGYYEAEHVVESVVELRAGTSTSGSGSGSASASAAAK